jgi:hypothetical protein
MVTRSYGNDEDRDGPDEDDEVEQLIARLRGQPPPWVHDPPGKPIARVGRAGDPPGGWGECDPALIDDSRPPVPAFPLEVLPPAWRAWVRDTAHAAAAPVDYVALSLIAAVGGLCGAGVRVRAAPGWVEPLVLWQALVGAPSSGKSPAIAPLRALLATLARERAERAADDATSSSPSAAPADPSLAGLGEAMTLETGSALLWCDEPADWLARLSAASGPARGRLLRAWSAAAGEPVLGLLACLRPEAVPLLAKCGVELAGRFLFAWPHPPLYRPLAGRAPADDALALAALRRLLGAGTAETPRLLILANDALPALDAFLARLHRDVAESEGLDQAWQGKGRGTVVRLIGCLALLEESLESTAAPGPIARPTVERGIALWRDYLRPQARAVLDIATPDDVDRKAREVVRWLRARGAEHVSREEIRCEALGRSVNAAGADRVLRRLQSAGVVKQLLFAMPPQGGRPPNRWQVNPHLMAAGNAGNPGNLENADGTAPCG